MTVHDVIMTYPMVSMPEGSPLAHWSLYRRQYDVPDGQVPLLTKAPLAPEVDPKDIDQAEAVYKVIFRYVLGEAGWALLARETNFNSNWGPAYTVFT